MTQQAPAIEDSGSGAIRRLGDDRETLEGLFRRVELGGVFDCTDCMPYEDELPIWIARDLVPPLAQLWPRIKRFVCATAGRGRTDR